MAKKTARPKSTPSPDTPEVDVPLTDPDILDVETAEIPEAAPAVTEDILRPSHLTEMIEKACEADGSDPAKVDRFRFIRDNGLPNPRRRYRVTGRQGNALVDPVTVDATDESDAIRMAADHRRIQYRDRHKVSFQTAVLEE